MSKKIIIIVVVLLVIAYLLFVTYQYMNAPPRYEATTGTPEVTTDTSDTPQNTNQEQSPDTKVTLKGGANPRLYIHQRSPVDLTEKEKELVNEFSQIVYRFSTYCEGSNSTDANFDLNLFVLTNDGIIEFKSASQSNPEPVMRVVDVSKKSPSEVEILNGEGQTILSLNYRLDGIKFLRRNYVTGREYEKSYCTKGVDNCSENDISKWQEDKSSILTSASWYEFNFIIKNDVVIDARGFAESESIPPGGYPPFYTSQEEKIIMENYGPFRAFNLWLGRLARDPKERKKFLDSDRRLSCEDVKNPKVALQSVTGLSMEIQPSPKTREHLFPEFYESLDNQKNESHGEAPYESPPEEE